MPATRSSGPPTSASLQPVIMEAFESFKQKHSKQNQDLIHKNRVLLKTISEFEQLIKDLKNQNIALRVAVCKARGLATQWRQKAELTSDPNSAVRLAVADIVARCRVIQSALDQPISPPHPIEEFDAHEDRIDVSLDTQTSYRVEPFRARPSKGHAELIALRERRRSQLAPEGEETRLSFIRECSGTDERLENSSHDTRPAESNALNNLESSSSSSSRENSPINKDQSRDRLIDTSFVSDRSHRRQSLLPSMHIHLPLSTADSGEASSKTASQGSTSSYKMSPDNRPLEIKAQSKMKPTRHGKHKHQMHEDEVEDANHDLCSFDPDEQIESEGQTEHDSRKSLESDNELSEDEQALNQSSDRPTQEEDVPLSMPDDARSRKKRRANLTPSLDFVEAISPGLFTLSSGQSGLAEVFEPVRSVALERKNLLSQRRRDSGLNKSAQDEDGVDEEGNSVDGLSPPLSTIKPNIDEGWQKPKSIAKKRARGALDVVKEEVHPPSLPPNNLSGGGSREARRARKEVNYALPSLNKKMRRPEDYVSSVKRSSLVPNGRPRGSQRSGQRSSSAGSVPSGTGLSALRSPPLGSSAPNSSSSVVPEVGIPKRINKSTKRTEAKQEDSDPLQPVSRKQVLQTLEDNTIQESSCRATGPNR